MTKGVAELFRRVKASPAAKVNIAIPVISPTATSAVMGVEALTVPFTAIASCDPTPAVMLTP